MTDRESFRDWLVSEHRADAKWESVEVLEGPAAPENGLAVRLHVANRSYYEVRLPESGDHVQVGLGTESRVVNEAVEEMVLDNGGDLDEILGDELCDVGDQPRPMEHFFERPAFRFIVRLPLSGPEELNGELRPTVQRVLKACHVLFQACIDEA